MASEATSISTLVFLDFETTGLPSVSCQPRATELCLIAVEKQHFLTATSDVGPRVTNKLILCFNPIDVIPPKEVEITGLSSENLISQKAMNKNVGELLQLFMKHLTPPICFIAHNGNKFDFILLNAEMNRIGYHLPENILCVDSMIAFKKRNVLEGAPVDSPLDTRASY